MPNASFGSTIQWWFSVAAPWQPSQHPLSLVMTYSIAAFYQFSPVADPAGLRDTLRKEFIDLGVCGTLLIAPEGINGTMATSSRHALDAMLALLHKHMGLVHQTVKFSSSFEKPFNKLKLKLKREIITFNQPQADPNTLAGTYVAPQDWNALISQDDVTVLDTRNLYETAIGTFAGALDPQIDTFTAFADFVRTQLDPKEHPKIAMFCTGGIRCEKASAFMRAEGFGEVYHLQGGILKYLEEIPASQSLWQGDCYVFDKRVAVGQGLKTGHYSMCYCCGYPLSAADRQDQHFEAGVSCAFCYDQSTTEDKARFRTRQRQSEQTGYVPESPA